VITDFADRLSVSVLPAERLVASLNVQEWVHFIECVSSSGVWSAVFELRDLPGPAVLTGGLAHGGVLVTGQIQQMDEPDREAERAVRLRKVIHDLQNPISSIITSCDYLVSYGMDTLEPDQVEMIARMESSARALMRLTHKIREVALGTSA
jgi:signal transduction histidine kinase